MTAQEASRADIGPRRADLQRRQLLAQSVDRSSRDSPHRPSRELRGRAAFFLSHVTLDAPPIPTSLTACSDIKIFTTKAARIAKRRPSNNQFANLGKPILNTHHGPRLFPVRFFEACVSRAISVGEYFKTYAYLKSRRQFAAGVLPFSAAP